MNSVANYHKTKMQRPDLPGFGEAISVWFAISSPLTGLILALLGAWFFSWLTS
jgi:hypothetical protein